MVAASTQPTRRASQVTSRRNSWRTYPSHYFTGSVSNGFAPGILPTTEEKIACVDQLERKGTFRIKGAVDQVAMKMGVSKYTVYSYLQKVRAVHEMNRI